MSWSWAEPGEAADRGRIDAVETEGRFLDETGSEVLRQVTDQGRGGLLLRLPSPYDDGPYLIYLDRR